MSTEPARIKAARRAGRCCWCETDLYHGNAKGHDGQIFDAFGRPDCPAWALRDRPANTGTSHQIHKPATTD